MRLELHPQKIVWFLSLSAVLMGVLHLIGCVPMFFMGRCTPLGFLSMDGEQNLPTLFSVMLLWICSLLTGGIAWANKSVGWRQMLPWAGLALAFFLMGADEMMQFHERFSEPIRQVLGERCAFRFAWVLPFSLLTLFFAAIYLRFFMHLPRGTRRLVFGAAVLFVGGAIGVEVIGGAWVQAHGKSAFYYLLVMAEELMEMSGAILFIYAFANHIDRHLPFSLRITSSTFR